MLVTRYFLLRVLYHVLKCVCFS